MGAAYPELTRAEPLITETLKLEETQLQADARSRPQAARGGDGEARRAASALPGEVAFKLYDTYGFPLDLTEDVLRGRGRSVAVDGFDAAMERQRAEARKHWVGSGEAATDRLVVRAAREIGRERVPGLRHATSPRGKSRPSSSTASRWPRRAPAPRRRSSSTRRRSTANWAGRSAIPARMFSAAGGEFAVRDTQKKAGDLIVHLGRDDAMARSHVGDVVELRIDESAAHQAARQSFGDASAAPGAAPAARASM